MSRILVGTASWTDKQLVDSGRFYPGEARTAEERLRFYASVFPLVEIDSSYYGMPSEQNAHLWVQRTPPGFTFNVKAFRLFTLHQTPRAAFPKDLHAALPDNGKPNVYFNELSGELQQELWTRFRTAIEPLQASGRLGAVHFQFAPWMYYASKNFAHIEACQAQLEGMQLAIEFRNPTWFEGAHRDRTLSFERDRGLSHVIVDGPTGIPNTIPAIWEVTSARLAVVRLHGRNHATWNQKGLASSAQRFNYDYPTAELEQIAGEVLDLAPRVGRVHVVLNNNFEDQGQRNGREIAAILDKLSAAVNRNVGQAASAGR